MEENEMVDWTAIRRDFPITKEQVYFQSAAMSPLPNMVFQKIVENYRQVLESGDLNWEDDLVEYNRLCSETGELINASPDDICFLPNTSTVTSVLALSFSSGTAPFNIVTTADEFPASTLGFAYREIPLRIVQSDSGRYSPESILAATDAQTLAVVVSYIQYATGFRQNLALLGRELHRRKILFVVNATQAFPYYPLDVKSMHIDALTASLHKWGLTGHIGALFYTSAEFRKRFPSPLAGWMSVDSAGGDLIQAARNIPIRLNETAFRYQLGTFNLQPLLAFRTALHYLGSIGWENIRERIHNLTDYLISGLNDLGISPVSPTADPEERSPIISFTLGSSTEAAVKELAARKIHVSFRDNRIRVAVNIFNNHNDIDSLISSLKTLRMEST